MSARVFSVYARNISRLFLDQESLPATGRRAIYLWNNPIYFCSQGFKLNSMVCPLLYIADKAHLLIVRSLRPLVNHHGTQKD